MTRRPVEAEAATGSPPGRIAHVDLFEPKVPLRRDLFYRKSHRKICRGVGRFPYINSPTL